jgi:hypothetical protein
VWRGLYFTCADAADTSMTKKYTGGCGGRTM